MDTREATTRKTSPNDANRVVWAFSTCFFYSFRFFYFTNLYLQVLQVLRCHGWIHRTLQREERAQTIAYRVVWAIRKFFLIIIRVFLQILIIQLIFIAIIDTINLRTLQLPTTRKTGPNNAFCVVWAISKCSFLLLLLYYLNIVYLLTTAPSLAPRGPNDSLPLFGPNKYYFIYIFALFIIIFIIYIYYLQLLIYNINI